VIGLAPKVATTVAAAPAPAPDGAGFEPLKLSMRNGSSASRPAQYDVLRHESTERAWTSPLNAEKRARPLPVRGLRPALFTSEMKFDSGTGWPSFYTTPAGAFRRPRPTTSSSCRAPSTTARAAAGHHGHVFERRPGAHRQALLQQRRRAQVRGGAGMNVFRIVARQRSSPGAVSAFDAPAQSLAVGTGTGGHREGDLRGRLLLVRRGRFSTRCPA
jgi:peptide-methionine (R)-S-oxide reductase